MRIANATTFRIATAAGILLLAVGRLAAQDAPVAPATQPATQGEKADERKRREAQVRHLPAARVGSMRDVVLFNIENDELIVRTSIPPTDMSAVVVDGRPTLTTVAIALAGNEAAPYQPVHYALIQHQYPPSDGVAITHVTVVGSKVSVSETSEGGGAFCNIDFIQDEAFLEEGDDRVRFYVQELHNDEQVANLKLSAASIVELRRKYPAETMRYLEPIFRGFGQSSILFEVDARSAWQVLGETYAPPEDIAARVDALLTKLDAESSQDREAAVKELEKLGQQAALVLMKRDRAKMSEEQQARVETFLAPYKPLTDEEAARMRGDLEFLLLSLSSDDAILATRALDQLKQVAKQPVTFDLTTAGPARTEAIVALRSQLLPATTRPATTQASSENAASQPTAAP